MSSSRWNSAVAESDNGSALLAEVWKRVGRQNDLEQTIEDLYQLAAARFPVGGLVVRTVDADRSSIETIAASGVSVVAPRTVVDAASLARVHDWLKRHRQPVRIGAADYSTAPRALVPDVPFQEAVLCPLESSPASGSLMIVVSEPGRGFAPVDLQAIASLVEPVAVAVENDRRLRELTALREAAEADKRSLLDRLGRDDMSDTIVGAASGLKSVMERVKLVARTEVPVLILGETGSGKEVVARAIHQNSRRADGPFLRVNCGAIAPDLIDSELFGHERGSFTGAAATRRGWFERADTGTLFLDECGELPPAVQVRLLRVLQDGIFERVGGERELSVDVRIIAATNRDLQAMAQAGAFRHDLWYRLAVFPVHLPPLRERQEDIPAMAAHFARRAAKRLGLAPCAPTSADLERLAAYPWPGNVRELSAVIERAAILGEGKYLDVNAALGQSFPQGDSLTATATDDHDSSAELPSLEDAMARHIMRALERTRGVIEGSRGAAQLLDINPHTLRARMRKMRIDVQAFRA